MLLLLALVFIRNYWPVDPAVFATNGSRHTHVVVTGYVSYVLKEDDGDTHLKIVPKSGVKTPFFVAECIPTIPCTKPVANARVKISGISRRDSVHNWNEVHPVEKLEILP